MKPLFNKYEAYNEDASRIADKIHQALRPIFKEEIDAGFSGREITSIAYGEVSLIGCELVVRKAMEMKKAERELKIK